jgi:DNA-binding MarR family transcriptional regulator
LRRRREHSQRAVAVRSNRADKRAATAGIVQGLRRIVKALHTYSRDVQREFGLTGPQLWAMKTLARTGPMTTGCLAEALVVHQSSLSILLNRLERRGLVRRSRDPDDRRVVVLDLTDKGRATATRAPEPAQGRMLHVLEGMTAAEVHDLYRAIERLVGSMEAEHISAPFFFGDG